MEEKSKEDSALSDLFVSLIFFGVGAWVYMDLSSLENGAVQSVKLWAPIAFLYNHLGFYPSALLLPLIGVALLFSAYSKWRRQAKAK